MNIQTEIKKTFAAVLALTLIIVIVLTLINGPTNYKQAQPFLMPLKEAIATTANYFGGITALAAAYIASRLFNDWKEEHQQQTNKEYIQYAVSTYNKFKDFNFDNVVDLIMIIETYKLLSNNYPIDHADTILKISAFHNSVIYFIMGYKLDIGNYATVSSDIYLSSVILKLVTDEETVIKLKYRNVANAFLNSTPIQLSIDLNEYHKYVSETFIPRLYNDAVLPLLRKTVPN